MSKNENRIKKAKTSNAIRTLAKVWIWVVVIFLIYSYSQKNQWWEQASLNQANNQQNEQVGKNTEIKIEENIPKFDPLKLDEVSSSDHMRWSETGEIIIIEYSDFQCPACYVGFRIVQDSWFMIASKVKYVYRNFPLKSIHPNAQLAAQFAEAAWKQWKFWEMHDKIFMEQKSWASSSNPWALFETYWTEIGLNLDQLRKDVSSKEVIAKINNDVKSATDNGLNQTPTFIVNWKKVEMPKHKYAFMNMVTFTEREMKWLWPDWKPLNWTGSTGTGS